MYAKIILRIWSLFGCFFWLNLGIAQQYPAPGVAVFGTSQGLKQTTLTHIFKADSGCLWVGTFAGMHRFNGQEFELIEKYNPNLKKELNSPVRDVMQLGSDLIYSTESHLFKLDLNNHRVTELKAFNKLNPCRFFRTSNNQIFVYQFNEGGGVFQFDTVNYQLLPFYKDAINRDYEEVAQLGDSLLLIDDSTAGWLSLTSVNPQLKKIDLPSVTTSYTIDKQRILLVYENGDSKIITSKGEEIQTSTKFKKPLKVFKLKDGIAVANGDGQLLFFDKDLQLLTSLSAGHIGISEKLNGSMVNSLIQDNTGTIWLGVDGVGLIRIHRLFLPFHQFPAAQNEDRFARKILEHNHAFWVGTMREIFKYENNEIKSFTLPVVGIGLTDLLVYDNDRLLIVIDHSLWFFDVVKEQFESIKIDAANFRLTNLAKTPGNKIYVSQLFGKVILEIQDNGEAKIFTTDLQAPETIKALFSLSNERLLVAITSGGYRVLDLKSKTFSEELLLAGYKITDCHSLNGIVWLTTANGLIRLTPDFLPETGNIWPEPLNDEFLYALIPDRQNRWWLSSNNGLYRFDVETDQISNFSVMHGLQSNEFNTGSAALLSDGRIAFGGIKGINVFYPDQISIDTLAPVPVITLIENAGKPVSIKSTKVPSLDLAQDQVALHIQLNSLNLSASEFNLFEYAIQSNEEVNWLPLGKNRDFFLHAMAPGNYSVLVRAANADGVWSATSSIFNLKVSPPFYKTWWFVLTISFLIIGIGFYLIFLRYKHKSERKMADFKRQQAIDSMRQRIADDIHDDLGAGLTRLTLITRQAAANTDAKPGQLIRISEMTQELTDSLREVVWAMKPELDNVSGLFAGINSYAHDYLLDSGIELKVNMPKTDVYLNPMQRQAALLILKEALNNILKHSKASSVVISFSITEHQLTMEIEDDGIGFDSSGINAMSNGLSSMNRRALEAKGIINISSSIGGPTRVLLTLNLK